MAKDLKTILQEVQVCINDLNLARHEAEDPDERRVLAKLFKDLSALSEEAWTFINPLNESHLSEDPVSKLDHIIGDYENKRLGYAETLQQLNALKASAQESGDDSFADEVQDYINRMDSIAFGESSKDLAGANFRETLRRLGRRKRQIQQESPTHHEFIDAMNAHNDEIEKYIQHMSDTDPRKKPLLDLVLYVSDYGLSD